MRRTLYMTALLTGILAGSARTNAATPGYCSDEYVDMSDPVLIVVSGPGDADTERLAWPDHASIEGTAELTIDGRSFALEPAR